MRTGWPFAGVSALSTSAARDSGDLLASGLKRKQLVDRDFQLARKIQRNFGIGNVGPGFDRVNGLAAHADAARQIRGAHASALSNLAQPVLDARLHGGYFLT